VQPPHDAANRIASLRRSGRREDVARPAASRTVFPHPIDIRDRGGSDLDISLEFLGDG